jgi:hypothetical protein
MSRTKTAVRVISAPDRVFAADLAVRMGDVDRARTTLTEIRALELDDRARAAMAADLATAAEIERDLA